MILALVIRGIPFPVKQDIIIPVKLKMNEYEILI